MTSLTEVPVEAETPKLSELDRLKVLNGALYQTVQRLKAKVAQLQAELDQVKSRNAAYPHERSAVEP